MKFRLKTLLFTLCGVGAAVGMMGNLLLHSPETFLFVLQIASTILPFVLATGTIIWMGLRGKRRRGLVAWGVLLLLAPVAIQGVLSLAWPSHDPLRILSSRRLIETRLPAQINEPWIWNELERRLSAGTLTKEEVNAALVQLIAMMKSTSPQGWNQPLAWQHGFVKSAAQANMISDETFLALCDAFYGPKPVAGSVRPLGANTTFQLELQFGNAWGDNSGLGVELLWNVAKVSIDGSPVNAKQVQRYGAHWNGFFDTKFEPGDHEVVFDVDCAYVDMRLATTKTYGTTLPTAQWPKAIKRWTTNVSVPVTVEERP